MRRKTNGFTLIELLAVIVILAIILIIAVPSIANIIKKSREDSYLSQVELIEKAAGLYASKYLLDKTVTLPELLSAGFLDQTPVDPRDNTELDGMVILSDSGASYKTNNYNGTHNPPEISNNMYPVKWNGTSWVVTTEDDSAWYTYNGDIDNSGDLDKNSGTGVFEIDEWANVHISTSSLNVGDTISESDLNMYVWIPRYSYLLTEGTKTIAIKYTNGATDDNTSDYLSHPGFVFGDTELIGIWVAKFEMSANTTSNDFGVPTGEAIGVSRPGVKPWRNISVSNIFDESRTIETEYSLTGNSHMIKSSEWSAVSYLAEAIRDGEEVWINNQGWYDGVTTVDNYKFITTGCAGTTKNAADNNATSVGCPAGYDYKTAGVKASTTGNIYGIYDMSGGSWDYMATYTVKDTSTAAYDSRYTSTGYMKSLVDSESKYKEELLSANTWGATPDSNDSSTQNYTANENNTNGLSFHEVSTAGTGAVAWYNDYSYFPSSNAPSVGRGGSFASGSYAGLFAFYRDYGIANVYYGWRAALVLE